MSESKATVRDNVLDRRASHCIGPWEIVPLIYSALTNADVGRTVIYRDHGRHEAGTLSSWRDGRVWARYSTGDTAAAADAKDLCFGVRAAAKEPA